MRAFFQLLVMPVIVLNALGGIVSGVWLMFIGQWNALFLGVLSFLGSVFLISIALMPQFGLGALAVACLRKGFKIPAFLLGVLASGYLYLLVTIWCVFVLGTFLRRVDTQAALIPTLVWSYGVASGPWAYMAAKESKGGRDAGMEGITTLFLQVGYVLMMLVILFTQPTPEHVAQAILVFIATMVIAFLVHVAVIGSEFRRKAIPEFN